MKETFVVSVYQKIMVGGGGMEYKAFLYFSRNKYDKIVYDLKGTQALNNKYGMREFW